MNVLFVLENEKLSTFYLVQFSQTTKRITRITPDFQMQEGTSLGELYVTDSLDICLTKVGQQFELEVPHFIILEQQVLLSFLFKNREQLEVSNPSEFMINNHTYKKKKSTLTREQLAEFIQFQQDPDGTYQIFERQEHIIRLIKNELLENKNPIVMQKKFKELKNKLHTNIGMKQFMTVFKTYVTSSHKQQLERVTEV